ncbi:unnamed protein product, partial [Polarella glacialis]
VSLPRESRRKRSCGVAFVVLGSREDARRAIQRLQGSALLGYPIIVEPVDGDVSPFYQSDGAATDAVHPQDAAGEAQPGGSRRISWKVDDELWDVAMFDKNESVEEFKSRMEAKKAGDSAPDGGGGVPKAHARFQAAASAERADERKLVREALSPGRKHEPR